MIETISWGLANVGDLFEYYTEITYNLQIINIASMTGNSSHIEEFNFICDEFTGSRGYNWSHLNLTQKMLHYKAHLLLQQKEVTDGFSSIMSQAMQNNPFRIR